MIYFFYRWTFKTSEHDIKFGISCKDQDGNTQNPLPSHRVSTSLMEETGALECPTAATCMCLTFHILYLFWFVCFPDTVTFDNSYSMLRNKKLHYNIEVGEPLSRFETDATLSPEEIFNSN